MGAASHEEFPRDVLERAERDIEQAGSLAYVAECDDAIAVVTTAPGSTSQRNVQRCGFHLLYTRALPVRDTV